jgi:hypothetical protein
MRPTYRQYVPYENYDSTPKQHAINIQAGVTRHPDQVDTPRQHANLNTLVQNMQSYVMSLFPTAEPATAQAEELDSIL